jgi:hypothetical protein
MYVVGEETEDKFDAAWRQTSNGFQVRTILHKHGIATRENLKTRSIRITCSGNNPIQEILVGSITHILVGRFEATTMMHLKDKHDNSFLKMPP